MLEIFFIYFVSRDYSNRFFSGPPHILPTHPLDCTTLHKYILFLNPICAIETQHVPPIEFVVELVRLQCVLVEWAKLFFNLSFEAPRALNS